MAWADHKCPCGGRKQPETLTCNACELHATEDPARAQDLRTFHNESDSMENRRWAAFRLLSAARRRTLPAPYSLRS